MQLAVHNRRWISLDSVPATRGDQEEMHGRKRAEQQLRLVLASRDASCVLRAPQTAAARRSRARSGSFPTTPPEERVRGAGEVDAMTQIQVSESGTLVRHGLCRRHAVVVVVVVLIVIIVVGVVGVHTCSVCARTRAFHARTSSG